MLGCSSRSFSFFRSQYNHMYCSSDFYCLPSSRSSSYLMETLGILFILHFLCFSMIITTIYHLTKMECFIKGKQIKCKMLDRQSVTATKNYCKPACSNFWYASSIHARARPNKTNPRLLLKYPNYLTTNPIYSSLLSLRCTLFTFAECTPLLSLSNSIIHSGAHFLDCLLGVFGAKDGSTSDEDVGACTQ